MFAYYLLIILVAAKSAMALTPATCQWVDVPNTNTLQGLNMSATSLNDCQSKCLADLTNCRYGIDWDPNNSANQCWFSSTNMTNTALGVYHYYYTCSLTTTPSISSSSVPCVWTVNTNMFTFGGTPINIFNDTLENCQNWCFISQTCNNGIDYNPSNPVGQRCYQSANSNLNPITGVNHYSLPVYCFSQTTITNFFNGTNGLLSLKILSAVLLFVTLVCY